MATNETEESSGKTDVAIIGSVVGIVAAGVGIAVGTLIDTSPPDSNVMKEMEGVICFFHVKDGSQFDILTDVSKSSSKLTIIVPSPIPEMKHFEVGDTIKFQAKTTTVNKTLEFLKLVSIIHGFSHDALIKHGKIQDFDIPFDLYNACCRNSATDAQGWKSKTLSPMFSKYFLNRKVCWSGIVIRKNRSLILVAVHSARYNKNGQNEIRVADKTGKRYFDDDNIDKGKEVRFKGILVNNYAAIQTPNVELIEILPKNAAVTHPALRQKNSPSLLLPVLLAPSSPAPSEAAATATAAPSTTTATPENNTPASGSSSEIFERFALLHSKWFIDFHEIMDLQKVSAFGGFGTIFKGNYYGADVALKKAQRSPNALDSLMNEASIMSQLPPHPNITVFYGITEDMNEKMLVIDWQPYSSLDALLINVANNISVRDILLISRQVLFGLEHLHKNNIIHRDLACRNVLVAKINPLHVKIGDFGLSVEEDKVTRNNVATIPWRWSAPESLRSNPNFSKDSDIWMYGVFLWECFMDGNELKKTPWIEKKNNDRFLADLQGGERLPKPSRCLESVYAMMLDCWNMEPTKRPSLRQLRFEFNGILSELRNQDCEPRFSPPPSSSANLASMFTSSYNSDHEFTAGVEAAERNRSQGQDSFVYIDNFVLENAMRGNATSSSTHTASVEEDEIAWNNRTYSELSSSVNSVDSGNSGNVVKNDSIFENTSELVQDMRPPSTQSSPPASTPLPAVSSPALSSTVPFLDNEQLEAAIHEDYNFSATTGNPALRRLNNELV